MSMKSISDLQRALDAGRKDRQGFERHLQSMERLEAERRHWLRNLDGPEEEPILAAHRRWKVASGAVASARWLLKRADLKIERLEAALIFEQRREAQEMTDKYGRICTTCEVFVHGESSGGCVEIDYQWADETAQVRTRHSISPQGSDEEIRRKVADILSIRHGEDNIRITRA